MEFCCGVASDACSRLKCVAFGYKSSLPSASVKVGIGIGIASQSRNGLIIKISPSIVQNACCFDSRDEASGLP